MRVSMSPKGSLSVMGGLPSPSRRLPAGLDQARDLSCRAERAQRDPRHTELAMIAARPAGQLAGGAPAALGAVARQRRARERRLEALLGRARAVAGHRAQLGALGGILLHQLAPVAVLLDGTGLGHTPQLLSIRRQTACGTARAARA